MGFKAVKGTTAVILSFMFWGKINAELNVLLHKQRLIAMLGVKNTVDLKSSGGLMLDDLCMMAGGWWAYRVAEKKLY